ncbi:MAG: ribosome silencing factor [bacterium]
MKAKATAADHENQEFDTEALARRIAELTWELKALNTVVIDLRGRVSYTDFVVVATANSERQVQALARYVEEKLKAETGVTSYGREGVDQGNWALIDFGDAILHVFNGPLRADYDLERMWLEAPRLELEGKPASLYGHFDMQDFDR